MRKDGDMLRCAGCNKYFQGFPAEARYTQGSNDRQGMPTFRMWCPQCKPPAGEAVFTISGMLAWNDVLMEEWREKRRQARRR